MAYRDWGSKTGGGGVASEDHEKLARRERLRQLTEDAVDLRKDPYFMRNHLGTYECKLCLTLHSNEGNYLAHTQGRRHQSNLRRRAVMESRGGVARAGVIRPRVAPPPLLRTPRIGRPGYEITKQRDPVTKQSSLLFQIAYPEIRAGFQPRHRFMSVFEQRVQPPDARYQYILFAADPYETVGFRIPNRKIDRAEGRFYTHWDADRRKFTLQLYFEKAMLEAPEGESVAGSAQKLSDANANVADRVVSQPSVRPMSDPFTGIGTT